MSRLKKRRFTLIECIVVLSIIGILLGMLFPMATKARRRACFVRWMSYNAMFNRDPDTVLNYNFQYPDYATQFEGSSMPALRNGAVGCGIEGFTPLEYDAVLMNEPEWIQGGGRWEFGCALQFDGRDDYALVPGKKVLDIDPTTESFTIMGWLTFDNLKGAQTLFSKSFWNASKEYDATMWKNKLDINIGDSNSSWKSDTIQAREWLQFALVSTPTEYKLFLNGAELETKNKTRPKKNGDETANLLLGAFPMNKGKKTSIINPFSGRMDEFILIRKSLDVNSIKGHYQMGKPN